MFDNKLSANYIPDRVCELIRLFLQNEQENFIEKLIKQIKSLEACFGKSRIKKLEEIGNKMMEVSMSQAQKEAEYRKILQLINSNIKEDPVPLDNDYSYNESIDGDKYDLRNLKEITSSLSNSTNSISNILKSFQSSFQKDVKKMKLQSRKLVNRLNNSSDNFSKLKSESAKLLKQNEQLNNRIKEMKDQNKTLSNKESQYQTELEKIKRKLQNQVQKQEESLKANKDLEEKLKDKYENKIQQMQNEMNYSTEQLNKKVSQLQEKNKQLKKELESSMNQNSSIDSDLNSLQQKVSQLQNSNRLLKMEVNSKQDTIDKYKNGRAKESQEFQKYLAKLTDQNKQNESELFKKDKQIRQIQSENANLQSELNQARKKLNDYEKQLKNKQKELKGYLAEKEKQSEDTNDMKNSFSEIIQSKDQEIARKQEKIENSRKERQQLLSQNSDLQNSLSQMEERLRRKESEIEQKQNLINSLQSENERLSNLQSKLKDGVSQYHDQVGKKESQIQLLQNKIQSLKNRNSELENSLHEYDQSSIQNQNQLDSKQREIGDLKSQFQKLQSTVSRLQEQVKKKDQELIEKQKTIDSFETENNEQTDLNTQLQETLLHTKDKLRQKEKEIMNLKRTIDDYQHENLKEKVAQIPIIQNEKEEAIKRGDNLEKQNQEMKRKMSELQLAVHEARQQLNHIKAIAQAGPNKEDLSRQIQNYMKENSDLKIQNAHLQNQIQAYKDEQESLRRSFESTNSQNKEKEKSIRQMKDKYNYTQQKMNESQMKVEQMTEKCSEYETSLKMLAKKYQQKEKQISMHKKDKNEIRRKLQNAEEENHKLSVSLSNVNDQLHNLKDEIRQKNDTISQLRQSSENQVTIQRELSNTQRALNAKVSLLNDSENRNSSLMREIEDKEAKICQLSDSILDKDRELKSIQQSEMSAKRQNETLTALTQEQQRKLEDAHREALALHEELIKAQNEALTQSESIKSISIDQFREAEGRKQIQQIINQDREKYRDRISKLQEENTSLSVSKVDLQHKYDQLSFENKTLSQLLEAKENELQFEKDRGSQDMQNATNVTNRIIDENKQLKQQLSDKNSYDKELLNQIRDYYSTIQNLDEIPDLIQQMVQSNEQLRSICDKLKVSDPSEIPSEISKLLKDNEELSHRDERIFSLFPDNNRDELPEVISDMKREFNELQDLKTKLQQLTNSSNIQKSVQTGFSSLKAFQKRESELARAVPNYSFDRLVSDVSQLIHSNQDNSKIIQQICSVLGVSFPNTLPDFVSGINRKLDNYQNTENQIKQIVLINNLHDIIPHLQKFVKQNDQLSSEHKIISSMVSNNVDGDDLPSKIASIIQENNANKAILTSLINSLPDGLKINKPKLINSLGKSFSKVHRKSQKKFFNNGDSDSYNESIDGNNELVEIVSHIANENEELKQQQKNLVENNLNPALKKNKELMKERSQIANNLKCNEQDDLPQKASEIVKENDAILSKLRKIESIIPRSFKGDDIPAQIESALGLLNDLQNERKAMNEIMSKDEDYSNNKKNDDVISNLQNLLEKKAEYAKELDDIDSVVSSTKDNRKGKNKQRDREDISNKVKELIKNKEQLQQTLNEIVSTLPNSKSDIQETLQNLIQKNAEHESILDKLNEMFPEGNDDLLKKVSQAMKDKHKSEEVLDEIDSLLQSSPNQELKSKQKNNSQPENIVAKLKNELNNEQEMDAILKHLSGILPRCSSKEEVVPRVEALLDATAAINSLLDSNGSKRNKYNSPNSKGNRDFNEEELIEKLKQFLELLANQLKFIETINSLLESNGNKKAKYNSPSKKGSSDLNEEEIIDKLKETLEQKMNHEKLIEAIDSLLPSANNKKGSDQKDLFQRVQQEIEQKKELEEQLSVLKSNLAKISGNECKTFDDVLNSISELQNRNIEMKDAMKSIDDILSNQKSATNISSNQNKKKTPNSKQQKQKRSQNEANESDDYSPLISQIKDNSNMLDQIDELFDQSSEMNLLDRIKKELEKSNEDLQMLNSIQSMIPESNSISDLQEKLHEILNEKESHKNIIKQASSILPQVDSKNKSKTKPKNNRNNNEDDTSNLINQAESAVEEIETMKSLINEIESALPPSKTKSDILSRLKDELDDKENVQKQLEILHSMIPNSEDLNDLPKQIQNTIKENENLKVCIREAHQILNSDDEVVEQRKSSQKRKKSSKNEDEIEPDQLLLELNQFKKEKEELKNQLSEIDSLLLQYEKQQNGTSKSKSRPFSKTDKKQGEDEESLLDRLKNQLESQRQNVENLEKIVKQLFGQSATYKAGSSSNKGKFKKSIIDDDDDNDIENARNINDIQSQIDLLQNERSEIQQIFLKELEKAKYEEEEGTSNRSKSKKSKQKNQKAKDNDDQNELNILDMANKVISAKNISDDTLAEISSILPEKANANDTLVMRLKRELNAKETLQKQLNGIQSMFPDSNSPDELNSLISSLQEAHNLSKDEQAELSSLLEEEGEEGPINTVQKILNEKKQLEAKLNQIDSLLPASINNNNNKSKSHSKAPKNDDVVERLKNELDKENEMKMILEQLCRILPHCSENEEVIPQTEKMMKLLSSLFSLLKQNRPQNQLQIDQIEEEEEDADERRGKDFDPERIINDVKGIINNNKQQNTLLKDIESLLPPPAKKDKSKQKKELSLLERIQNELDQKKDLEDKQQKLQKQLAELSGGECESFDDVTKSISQLQNKNLEMKNTIESIGTIFSTKATEKPKKKSQSKTTFNDDGSLDQEQLIQKVDSYVDASENDRKLLSEIESLLPHSNEKIDLSTRIKNELNKKNEVQQLTGELQSMIPGVKTPEQLASKVKKFVLENESLKKELEIMNQILNKSKLNDDQNENDGKSSLVDHLLPQQQIEQIRKREMQNNINNNDDDDEDDEENEKLHKKITSKVRLVVDQNAIYQEFADNVVSLLPKSSEQENTKKPKKNKKGQQNSKAENDNEEDVLTRLKNELKIKEKVIKQLDKLCSLLSVQSNDSLSSLFDDSLSSKIHDMLNEKETLKQKVSQVDSIIPRNQEAVAQKKHHDEDEDEEDEKDDDLIPRCHLLVQAKEKQDSILNEINSLLQKSSSAQSASTKNKSKGKSKNKNAKNQENNNDDDIIQKLKNELNEKEQLIQLLDSLKSLTNGNNNEGQLIDHFKSLLNSNNEFNQFLNEIYNLLNIKDSNKEANDSENDEDSDNENENDKKTLVISKIRDLINKKDELQKSIDEIQSLLPKSKTKESLLSRLQKELKKKDNSIKQLETMQSLLPSIKSPDDILGQMQTVLKESNELKGIIIEMIKIIPSDNQNNEEEDQDDEENEELLLNNNKENVVPRMKKIMNERNYLKQQMDQIIPLLTSQPSSKPSSSSPVELLKLELKNGRNAQKKINGLLSLIPDSNDPENLLNTIQKVLQDNDKMIKIIDSLQQTIPSLEEIKNDTLKLKDIIFISNNENLNESENNDNQDNEEEEEVDSNINSDLTQRAELIVSLNEALKKSVDEFDSILPNKEKSATALPSPSSQKGKKMMNQQKKKKKDLIIDRLKNEMNEKGKLADQIEKINNLIENSGSKELTDSLQNILQNNNKLKDLFKESFEIIKKNREDSNIKKENDNEEEEEENENFDSEKYLFELKRLMSEFDEMKKEIQSIDDLITQQEQPKIKPKQSNKSKSNQKVPKKQEDLKTRIEKQIEKKKLNKENLDKIFKQLFGESFNYEDEENAQNIENILSHIKDLQNEHKELLNLISNEIESGKKKKDDNEIEFEEEEEDNDNENRKQKLIILTKELISLKKESDQILSQINSIVPTQFESQIKSKPKNKQANQNENEPNLLSRVEKVVSEYKQMKSDIIKINSLLPKKENDEEKDLPSRIEELLHSNEELTSQMDDLHSLFPLTKSQEEFKLSVTGMMKEKETLTQLKTEIDNLLSEQFPELDNNEEEEEEIARIPSKLRRLLKEKEELSVLLGVNENHKSAVEILLEQKSNLKKERDAMYDILSQLRSTLNCDSNEELLQKVVDQKQALKSSSDLFIKMLETLIGPLSISTPIQLPISDQMKEKLFSILAEMKKQTDETHEKVIHVLNKAKKTGFDGTDLIEAVNYLEKTAVLFEQQKVDEQYHGQVSTIRELMSEQEKKYDDAKKQFKSANKEKEAKLSELQEKFSLREEEIISENEENKKKIIILQEDLDKANKTKSELLRLACGQASDIDFLRNNLNRSEYTMLMNAEKNRKSNLQKK